MKATRLLLCAVVAASVGGCQTLTEELPSQSTSGSSGLPQIPAPPIVVVPIPIPVPQPPQGGGGTPPSQPDPEPPSGNPNGQIPNNTNPVARVGAKVYFVECGGQQVPGSEGATDVQVGCRIHFDCTPKDAANDPTQAHNPPTWTFNGPVSAGNVHDFTPTVTAQSPGNLTAYVTIDGVTSNTLNVSIHN